MNFHPCIPNIFPGLRLRALAGILCLATVSSIAATPDPLSDSALEIFAPLKSQHAALSPDGRYLAFSERDGNEMFISYIEVDQPDTILGKSIIGNDKVATPYLDIQRKERTPTQIAWMQWLTPEILVVETNQKFQRSTGAIATFDISNWQGQLIAAPTKFLRINKGRASSYIPRIEVLDLNPKNEHEVLIKVGSTYDFDLYALDAVTGETRLVRREISTRGRAILLNRQFEGGLYVPNTSLARLPFPYYLQPSDSLRNPPDLRKLTNLPFVISKADHMATRAIPIGFNEAGDHLFYATNKDRSTFAIFELDLKSGQDRLLFADENYDIVDPVTTYLPAPDTLVYDRFTRKMVGVKYSGLNQTAQFRESDLARIQESLETFLPDHSVEIREWDRNRNRFVVRTYQHADRGSIRVIEMNDGQPNELVRLEDRRAMENRLVSLPFTYRLPDGSEMTGRLTLPHVDSEDAVPLLVLCPSAPWERVDPQYDPRREFFAKSGFAVAEFNGRVAAGLGRQLDENDVLHVEAERDVTDLKFLVDALTHDFQIDAGQVAILGESFGGYGVLRSALNYPDTFKAVVAVDPPLNPIEWLEKDRWSSRILQRDGIRSLVLSPYFTDSPEKADLSLRRDLRQLNIPALFYTSRKYGSLNPIDSYNTIRTSTRRINANGGSAGMEELHIDFLRGLPRATAQVYASTAAFLTEHMDFPFTDLIPESDQPLQVAGLPDSD